MKMKTIEEKAKRYDEAIKRAKGVIEQNPLMEYLKKGIEYIFPELAETEDERIRKALLEMVHDTTGDSLWVDYNVHKEDVLAWLEKQGEQKQDPCDNCKDVRLNCHNFPCTKKRAFKQGKSALEVIKEEPQVYDTEDGEIITYSETDGYKLVGPKFHEGQWITIKE